MKQNFKFKRNKMAAKNIFFIHADIRQTGHNTFQFHLLNKNKTLNSPAGFNRPILLITLAKDTSFPN